MAQIPLFTPDYLASPTMMGAISPTTARVMAEAGKSIAERIESNSIRFDAQRRAPQIAELMGQGMALTSQGDFEGGFSLLAKASAMGAGNPMLARMAGNAVSEGSRMAGMFMDNAIATARLEREDSRYREASIRDGERELALIDRQTDDDWRGRVAAQDNTYAKQVEAYQQNQAAENRAAQIEGRAPNKIAPPVKPAPPPRPQFKSRVYGGPGVSEPLPSLDPNAGDFNGDILPPPTSQPNITGRPRGGGRYLANTDNSPVNLVMADSPAANIQGGGDFEGETATPAPSKPTDQYQRAIEMINEKPQGQQAALVNEKVQPIEIGKPRPPQTKGNEVTVPFGRMNFILTTPNANNMRVSETVDTATGSKTYSFGSEKDKTGDNVSQFAQLVAQADNLDHAFADWASTQFLQGKKVTVEPNPAGEKEPWIAKANGEPMSVKNPAAATDKDAPATVVRGVSPLVGEVWNKAAALMPELAPVLKKEHPVTKDQITQERQRVIGDIAAGKISLEEVNAGMKKRGFDQISEAEVKKAAKPQRTVDPEVKKSLERKGIKDPNEKKAEPKPKEGRDREKEIRKQIADLKKKVATEPELYYEIADLQKELNALEGDREQAFKDMVGEGMTYIN